LRRATYRERQATARCNRFLATAASELRAPVEELEQHLDQWADRPPPEWRARAHVELDELRRWITALADWSMRRVGPSDMLELEVIDLGEVMREILGAPPFSSEGPSVILRAYGGVTVEVPDRKLVTGLRALL